MLLDARKQNGAASTLDSVKVVFEVWKTTMQVIKINVKSCV